MEISSRTSHATATIINNPTVQKTRQLAERYGDYALGAATVVAMTAAILMALLYAPTLDVNYGFDIQRIEYFHVGIAWIAYLTFFVVLVGSVMYLWRGDERWDWLAHASAEIGVVFSALVLISGSLWGKGFWGTWWDWHEPRLVTTLVLWFIYVGYLLLRSYSRRSEGVRRNAAILGIAGFVAVPLNYVSITWLDAKYEIHPQLGSAPQGSPVQAPQVVITLLVAVVAFTLLYAFLLLQVYRLQRLQTEVERLRIRAELDEPASLPAENVEPISTRA
jgi:heme exporter protein C